jgi:hypothetical protein
MANSKPSTIHPIFKIAKPESYRCNILRYDTKLSQIYVRAFKGASNDPGFYLIFTDVGYFEGPLNWQGAVLYKMPAKACLNLMLEAGMLADLKMDDPETQAAVAATANLYQFKTTFRPVQLIGGSVIKRDSLEAT